MFFSYNYYLLITVTHIAYLVMVHVTWHGLQAHYFQPVVDIQVKFEKMYSFPVKPSMKCLYT